jgi:GT2 family glycosyltransferase
VLGSGAIGTILAVELSYCVVSTAACASLLRCLAAIEATHPAAIEHEVLVLDNASGDGSAEAAARSDHVRVIARDRRAGLAENSSLLLREARGALCLLMHEDVELLDGAAAALCAALRQRADAAVAGPALLDADGALLPSAWRLPSLGTAVAEAVGLRRRLVEESRRSPEDREVGWVRGAAMLVRREAAIAVRFLDPDFFLHRAELDFQRRLRDAGWGIVHVPAARAIHHRPPPPDRAGASRRIVQLHRGRDLYLRRHHSGLTIWASRPLAAWPYVVRTVGAVVQPGGTPRAWWLHARRALRPRGGEGMAEAAEGYNRRLASEQARVARRRR